MTQPINSREVFKFEGEEDYMDWDQYYDDDEQGYYDDCDPEYNEDNCEFVECEEWEYRADDNDCWRELCYSDCGLELCKLWHLDSWNDQK